MSPLLPSGAKQVTKRLPERYLVARWPALIPRPKCLVPGLRALVRAGSGAWSLVVPYAHQCKFGSRKHKDACKFERAASLPGREASLPSGIAAGESVRATDCVCVQTGPECVPAW